jgi:hypothetical protein
MVFDVNTLSENDLNLLNEAIQRTAPKVRFWYNLPSTHSLAIKEQEIIEQTRATSDLEKLHKEHPSMVRDKLNLRKFHSSHVRSQKKLRSLLGFRDWELCVYNPQKPLTALSIGRKKAELIQIDGIGIGNTYIGRILFEQDYAVINEADQDIAHSLGLMFTPSGTLERDCLTASDPEMNQSKVRPTGLELYCDNSDCQKEVRNPCLIVDDKTGGLYHSLVCYDKDIRIKRYLGIEGCSPRKVSLDEAREMFRTGLLQQSPNYHGNSSKLRSLGFWPEAAIVLPL